MRRYIDRDRFFTEVQVCGWCRRGYPGTSPDAALNTTQSKNGITFTRHDHLTNFTNSRHWSRLRGSFLRKALFLVPKPHHPQISHSNPTKHRYSSQSTINAITFPESKIRREMLDSGAAIALIKNNRIAAFRHTLSILCYNISNDGKLITITLLAALFRARRSPNLLARSRRLSTLSHSVSYSAWQLFVLSIRPRFERAAPTLRIKTCPRSPKFAR